LNLKVEDLETKQMTEKELIRTKEGIGKSVDNYEPCNIGATT
jgi:hypothetical protein